MCLVLVAYFRVICKELSALDQLNCKTLCHAGIRFVIRKVGFKQTHNPEHHSEDQGADGQDELASHLHQPLPIFCFHLFLLEGLTWFDSDNTHQDNMCLKRLLENLIGGV